MRRLFFSIAISLYCTFVFAQKKAHIVGTEVNPFSYAINKSKTYSNAAVATAHPLASEIGVAIMKQGGNAFDAAIAVNFTLAVVYPAAGNIGGGGLMTARKKDGKLLTLDYREKAPAAASRNMYLDSAGNVVPDLSINGHLSCGVPGTVAGMFAIYKYAKLPMKVLIQPAIDLAQHGYVITASEANSLNHNKADFVKYNTQPTAFVKEGDWKAGDTLVQPELAQTLLRIRDEGANGFYAGKTADLIVEEMKRGKGLINYKDLKSYDAKLRTPMLFLYRGYQVVGFPPPSSGGILLAQMLGMIEPFPIKKWGFESPQTTQVMIEAERRAYADRAKYMGDPDFYNVPQKALISKVYLAKRMKDFDTAHASKSENIEAGLLYESKQTTHISIIDKWGNMVAITTTLNNLYGSKTVVGGGGFFLNDEMDDFSAKPGVPNMYGAVGGEANAIAPGKRMLSSMTPTLVLKNNKPFVVVGTPGGTTIPTSVFQTIVDIVDFNMTAAGAVNAPKFHHQWLPDEVMVEPSFPSATQQILSAKGYHFIQEGAIGRTEVIKITKKGVEAAADIRGNDSADGF
ncbi:MAG: gamma-glutamyltransferase [Bacteroidota bacterium]|nr:gamma-glutamyltransferase [Bacteroidota bacterium]